MLIVRIVELIRDIPAAADIAQMIAAANTNIHRVFDAIV